MDLYVIILFICLDDCIYFCLVNIEYFYMLSFPAINIIILLLSLLLLKVTVEKVSKYYY